MQAGLDEMDVTAINQSSSCCIRDTLDLRVAIRPPHPQWPIRPRLATRESLRRAINPARIATRIGHSNTSIHPSSGTYSSVLYTILPSPTQSHPYLHVDRTFLSSSSIITSHRCEKGFSPATDPAPSQQLGVNSPASDPCSAPALRLAHLPNKQL